MSLILAEIASKCLQYNFFNPVLSSLWKVRVRCLVWVVRNTRRLVWSPNIAWGYYLLDSHFHKNAGSWKTLIDFLVCSKLNPSVKPTCLWFSHVYTALTEHIPLYLLHSFRFPSWKNRRNSSSQLILRNLLSFPSDVIRMQLTQDTTVFKQLCAQSILLCFFFIFRSSKSFCKSLFH